MQPPILRLGCYLPQLQPSNGSRPQLQMVATPDDGQAAGGGRYQNLPRTLPQRNSVERPAITDEITVHYSPIQCVVLPTLLVKQSTSQDGCPPSIPATFSAAAHATGATPVQPPNPSPLSRSPSVRHGSPVHYSCPADCYESWMSELTRARDHHQVR